MAKERAYSSDGEKWAAELVERIGSAMKMARPGGKSAAWLSGRTEEVGYRISPTVISKLDSGHRGGVLSVPELLVIAAALEIPALDLLYSDHDEQVQVLPGVSVSTKAARSRFIGIDLETVEVKVQQAAEDLREANNVMRQANDVMRQAIEAKQQAAEDLREANGAMRQAIEAGRKAAEDLRGAVEIRQQLIARIEGATETDDYA